jgi:hypothetical protein
MKHVTPRAGESATLELDSQTHVKPDDGSSDAQSAGLSPASDSQPLAANPGSPASHTQNAHAYQTTEDALRTVETCLNRIAAAYLDSLRSRISGAR